MLPRWQPGVRFLPASACVTCASGSSCMVLIGWEHWRWPHLRQISLLFPAFGHQAFFFFFNCHLLRNDPKWRLNLDLSEISFLFYSAYQHILLCLLSVTWYPKEGMNVFLPANNPSKHVRLQTSLSYQSFHVFLGLFVKWVNFKTTNNKHLLKALLRQEVYSMHSHRWGAYKKSTWIINKTTQKLTALNYA